MDGGASGSAPPFNFQRWRRQFAVAHLKDLVRDWQNPQPGPDEVLAAMRAAPVAPLQGEPFGVGMGALLGVDPGLVPRSSRRGPAGPPAQQEEDKLDEWVTDSLSFMCSCHDEDIPVMGGADPDTDATDGTLYEEQVYTTCDKFVYRNGRCECRYTVIDSTLTCRSCADPPPGDYMCGTEACMGGKCTPSTFKQYMYDMNEGGCVPVYGFSGTTKKGKSCSDETRLTKNTVACGEVKTEEKILKKDPCYGPRDYDWGGMTDAAKGSLSGLVASVLGGGLFGDRESCAKAFPNLKWCGNRNFADRRYAYTSPDEAAKSDGRDCKATSTAPSDKDDLPCEEKDAHHYRVKCGGKPTATSIICCDCCEVVRGLPRKAERCLPD